MSKEDSWSVFPHSYARLVEKFLLTFIEENFAANRSLDESWRFEGMEGNTVKLRNTEGIAYIYDPKNHRLTRVIEDKERDQIERECKRLSDELSQ